MPNYKLTIQYEGTRYKGWQEQKHTEATIQGKLQRVLERMTEEEIDLQGSGRTDAGVHAKGQIAHFHTKAVWDVEQIKKYMNEYLPEDIAILQVEQVDGRFHSRLNAKSKTYEYRIYKGSKPSRNCLYNAADSLCKLRNDQCSYCSDNAEYQHQCDQNSQCPSHFIKLFSC